MNYFNYFTEIEEAFQRARGRRIYLCPLDWALIESWKAADIPLSAALAGIEQTFASLHSSRRKDADRPRSLAYCAAGVLKAAEVAKAAAVGGRQQEGPAAAPPPGWERARVAEHLRRGQALLLAALEAADSASALPAAARPAVAAAEQKARELLAAAERRPPAPLENAESSRSAGAPGAAAALAPPSLQEMDQWLTAADDQIFVSLESAAPLDVLVAARAACERELAPHRRRLKTEQLAMVERQLLRRRLLEHYRLPRLSLFFMS